MKFGSFPTLSWRASRIFNVLIDRHRVQASCCGGDHHTSQATRLVLPPELIGIVFEDWLFYELDRRILDPSDLPLLLCYVSKSWKELVYGTPLLWRFIFIDASEHRTINLQTLQTRLSRAQGVSLLVSLFIRASPNLNALRILFSSSNQFGQLSLKLSNPLWWDKVPMEPFGMLRKLDVGMWRMSYGLPELSSLFSAAPLLQHLIWSAPTDLVPLLCVHGHQLRSLDLHIRLDVIRILHVLAACPNLYSACVSFHVHTDQTSNPQQIVLGNLRSLKLLGPGVLIQILENVRAPLLSTLSVTWRGIEDNDLMDALLSFLAHSPLLEDFMMQNVIFKEEALIEILRTHPRISRLFLGALARDRPTGRITDRTFRMLTRSSEKASGMDVLLPQLEELVIRRGLRVRAEVIIEMIESRCRSPLSQNHTTIKLVELDWCAPMAPIMISRLRQICQKGGVTVRGSFMQENGNALQD
ncbi:hypothetical protein V8B97DRAFT_2025415 [Scleroderma yunnanense]